MWAFVAVRSSGPHSTPCRQVITTPAGETLERLVHQAATRAGVMYLFSQPLPEYWQPGEGPFRKEIQIFLLRN